MLETNQTIIKYKLGLLNLVEKLGNVSKACKMMRCATGKRSAAESGAVA